MKEITPECQMVDRLVEQRLLNGGVQLDRTAREHIDGCLRCCDLYRTFSQEAWGGGVPVDIERRITEELKSNLKPVRPLPPSWAIACAIGALFLAVSAAIMMGMTLAGVQVMSSIQFVGVSVFLLFGLTVLAGALARQMRPGSAWPISQRWLLALLIAGLGTVFAALFPSRGSGDFVASGLHCLQIGLLLALPAGISLGYVISRGVLLDLPWTGATAGATAGWLGVTVLQYTCELQNTAHLLVWHLGAVLFSTVAGAVMGHILTRTTRSL